MAKRFNIEFGPLIGLLQLLVWHSYWAEAVKIIDPGTYFNIKLKGFIFSDLPIFPLLRSSFSIFGVGTKFQTHGMPKLYGGFGLITSVYSL